MVGVLHFRSSDPRLQNSRLPNETSDTSSRLVNLDFILRSIRSFVQVRPKQSPLLC